MTRFIFVALSIFFLSSTTTAQLFPSPNAKLHYTLIPFVIPTQTNASLYTVLIAKGNYNEEALFKKNIIIRQNDTSSRKIVQVPSFGSAYTWQWTYKKQGKTIGSPLYHFTTLRYPYTDSQGNYSSRMRVTKNDNQFPGAAILVDCTRTLYDINGNPIWFVPEGLCPEMAQGSIQDLKTTQEGTFTFIYNSQAYEINYLGNLLTKITSDKVPGVVNDVFHHELIKLVNGNFMVLGNETFFQKNSEFENRTAVNAQDTIEMYRQIQMGTLLEFDSKGNLIWQWKSSSHFNHSDLASRLEDKDNTEVDFHLNAFSFNQADSTLYLGFRNISRIIKLKYPSGEILNNYGYIFTSATDVSKEDLFCYQHSIIADSSNRFYVFNNNACSTPPYPELIYFSESKNVKGLSALTQLKRFKFINIVATRQPVVVASARPGKLSSGNRGGCFNLLENGNYFVSLNAPYNELIILDKEGNYLWTSVIESNNLELKKWTGKPTYRSFFVAPKFLKTYIMSNL